MRQSARRGIVVGVLIALCGMMPVYASPAKLDVMRAHDMDFFAVPEGHYVYAQGIGHYTVGFIPGRLLHKHYRCGTYDGAPSAIRYSETSRPTGREGLIIELPVAGAGIADTKTAVSGALPE